MILLSSTITISIGLESFLILLSIITVGAIFFGINAFAVDKVDTKTRYKDYGFGSMYKRSQNILIWFGLFLLPFFKNTMIDGRKYMVYEKKMHEIKYYISMGGDCSSNREKLFHLERIVKLMKLKNKRKSFVIRNFFTIFVSK